jgi:hypothetical protein
MNRKWSAGLRPGAKQAVEARRVGEWRSKLSHYQSCPRQARPGNSCGAKTLPKPPLLPPRETLHRSTKVQRQPDTPSTFRFTLQYRARSTVQPPSTTQYRQVNSVHRPPPPPPPGTRHAPATTGHSLPCGDHNFAGGVSRAARFMPTAETDWSNHPSPVSRSENGARLCRRPAAARGELFNTSKPRDQGRRI